MKDGGWLPLLLMSHCDDLRLIIRKLCQGCGWTSHCDVLPLARPISSIKQLGHNFHQLNLGSGFRPSCVHL